MATIKSYTTVEQSRKLAEILSIESADLYYYKYGLPHFIEGQGDYESIRTDKYHDYIPCWSLAALLDILPDDTNIIKDKSDTENEKYMCTVGVKGDIIPTFGKNPVDACYEMILKLHELNLL